MEQLLQVLGQGGFTPVEDLNQTGLNVLEAPGSQPSFRGCSGHALWAI